MSFSIIQPEHFTSSDRFQYNGLPGKEAQFLFPIDKNKMRDLKRLARLLGLDSTIKDSKELLTQIKEHITDVPLSVTLEEHPDLILQNQIQTATVDVCNSALDCLSRKWAKDRTTAIHFGYLGELLSQQYMTQIRFHKEYVNDSTPRWMSYIQRKPPSPFVPHWRIEVFEGKETHDGYCSEGGCEVDEWVRATYYLPVKDKDTEITWKGRDIAQTREWSAPGNCGTGGSGYCNAKNNTELLGFERVDEPPTHSPPRVDI